MTIFKTNSPKARSGWCPSLSTPLTKDYSCGRHIIDSGHYGDDVILSGSRHQGGGGQHGSGGQHVVGGHRGGGGHYGCGHWRSPLSTHTSCAIPIVSM